MKTNSAETKMTSHHLTAEAMLRWQIGEATAAERAHVDGCAACTAQTQPLADALKLFGESAREWGNAKAGTAQQPEAVSPLWPSWGAMAAVCALLLLTLGIGAARWQAHRTALQATARQQQVQQELAQDNALLEAVDQDVSQLVPDALTPLSDTGSGGSTQQ